MVSIRTWDRAFHWSTYASVFAATLGSALLVLHFALPAPNVQRIVAVNVTPGATPELATPLATPVPVAPAAAGATLPPPRRSRRRSPPPRHPSLSPGLW